MAKVNQLKAGLGTLKKKPIITEKTAEKITEKVHGVEKTKARTVSKKEPKREPKKKPKPREVYIKTTIDFPKSFHKEMRKRLIDVDLSMKDYVLRLIEIDIKKHIIK